MSDDDEDPCFEEKMSMWMNFREKSASVACVEKSPIADTETIPSVASLYDRALKEAPERAESFDVKTVGRLLEEGDPYEKRSIGKSHQGDPCRACL